MSTRLYPRSFPQLLVGTFLLVALPLAFALLFAAVTVEQLAEQSRRAVGQTAEAARASRELLDETVALERIARQFLVLGDETLLVDYTTLRQRFKETTSELSLLPLDEAQLTELNRTIDAEQTLFERLTPRIAEGERPGIAREFAALSTLARGVQRISDALIDREVLRLTESADAARGTFWQLLAIMMAIGAAAVALGSRLVTRPIGQLEAAIRRLGGGDLVEPVGVQGPADLEHLGERLDWLRCRLGELEAQKSRFLRHVSHELKTPLTALREGAELLADGTAGALSSSQQEIVEILRQKSLQLQRLIERLLDYQRTLEGLGRLQRQPVRLDSLVQEVVAEHRLECSARRVEVRLELEPLAISGDGQELATVFDNLVSNAIKHSPDDAIIAVSLRERDGAAEISVTDQGPGVAEADLERIFDWFFRGTARPHGPVPGSGLGLAIARELAQAHNGRLEARSGPGGHFVLTLPLAERTSTQPSCAASSLPSSQPF